MTGVASRPKDSDMIPVATSMDSASSLSSVPFFCESWRNLTMEAASRRVVGLVLPLMMDGLSGTRSFKGRAVFFSVGGEPL